MTVKRRQSRPSWHAAGQPQPVATIDPQSNGTLCPGFQPAAVAVDQRAVWVAPAA
jgi:hypothetical protein